MRLTNIDRDAFIKAVLDDVPFVDYQELARIAIQKKAIELLPPKLRALHKEFGHWFKTDTMWSLPRPLTNVTIVSLDDIQTKKQMEADEKFWTSIEAMANQAEAQKDQRSALNAKLKSCIYGCTTAKQAHERMPEFASYLPADDDAPIRTLPVVANVVADLVAAGWPKDKKKPAARKAA